MHLFRTVAVSIVLITCEFSAANAQKIDWEVVNRFRVIVGERANNQYVAGLLRLRDAGQYRPLIVPKKNSMIIGSELNFPTHWSERRSQYKISWVHDRTRDVRVALSGVAKGSVCRWTRNDNAEPGNSCGNRDFANVPIDQTTTIRVEVIKGSKTRKLEASVAPKDIFVAVIGDSTASGEGNPHLVLDTRTNDQDTVAYPAIWWDTRCHRSLLSSGAQAAAFLAERKTKASVTFVNYGCSGAEIKDGVLTTSAGRETVPQVRALWEKAGQSPLQEATMNVDGTAKSDKNALESQIARLEQLLCPPSGDWQPNGSCSAANRRSPDILLVAVGANDIGFGEIARDLLMSSADNSSPEALQKWRAKMQDEIRSWLKKLGDDYKELADAVREKIAPKRVLLLEYVNPVMYTDAKGKDQVCGTGVSRFDRYAGDFGHNIDTNQKRMSFGLNNSLYNVLLSKDEGQLAQWVVLELNKAIGSAGEAQPWIPADGKASVVKLQDLKSTHGLRRGICAKNTWFISVTESWNRQDWIPEDKINSYPLKLKDATNCDYVLNGQNCMVPAGNLTSGILHPNFFGHYNAGSRILMKMEQLLAPL